MKKVCVLGSCVTRDLFDSKFNPDYKNYFENTFHQLRSSIISVMSESIDYNEDSIKIFNKSKENKIKMDFIKQDLEKSILINLKLYDVDYLIMDFFFEVYFGILLLENKKIITNNYWDFPLTEFFNNLDIKKKITVHDDWDCYFDLFKNSCELFFDYLNKEYPNIKVVINPVRLGYVNSSEFMEFRKDYKKRADKSNHYLEKLENYVIMNYDVNVLDLNLEYLLNPNHLWNSGPVHYEPAFYHNRLLSLRSICELNDSINEEDFRLLNRKYYLNKIDGTNYFESNDKKQLKKVPIISNNNWIKCSENKFYSLYYDDSFVVLKFNPDTKYDLVKDEVFTLDKLDKKFRPIGTVVSFNRNDDIKIVILSGGDIQITSPKDRKNFRVFRNHETIMFPKIN